jgi:hypothetical protein
MLSGVLVDMLKGSLKGWKLAVLVMLVRVKPNKVLLGIKVGGKVTATALLMMAQDKLVEFEK